MFFLMGLNDACAAIRDQIPLQDPLPPINNVFSLVVQAENQWYATVPNPIADTFASAVESQPLGVDL